MRRATPPAAEPLEVSWGWGQKPKGPSLKMSPVAYLHWQYLCHAGPTEVAAFGIAAADDPLKIERLWVPKQECTPAFCETDEGEFNELLEWAFDNSVAPNRVGRVWFHTHPGSSATPSGTDENTFLKEFGKCDFAVMAILARGGQTSCRLRLMAAGGVSLEIPIEVCWNEMSKELGELVKEASTEWESEYAARVREDRSYYNPAPSGTVSHLRASDLLFSPFATETGPTEREIKNAEDDFREWLDARYDMTPEELDADSRKQALEEFESEGGSVYGQLTDDEWAQIESDNWQH